MWIGWCTAAGLDCFNEIWRLGRERDAGAYAEELCGCDERLRTSWEKTGQCAAPVFYNVVTLNAGGGMGDPIRDKPWEACWEGVEVPRGDSHFSHLCRVFISQMNPAVRQW